MPDAHRKTKIIISSIKLTGYEFTTNSYTIKHLGYKFKVGYFFVVGIKGLLKSF
jgi:hypothetical protein